MDKGHITFFDVNACGFYRLKQKSSELDLKFGSLVETFEDLDQWLEGKKFEQTIPWNTEELPNKSKTYCRGIAKNDKTGDYIVVIYRAVGDHSGNIHGIKVGTEVGPNATGTVVAGSEHEGEEIIWGQPCYYWIIPELNKIASINFAHSSSDTSRFSNYVKEHVNNNSQFGERTRTTQEMPLPFNPERIVKVIKTTFPYGEGKEKCNCLFKFNVKESKMETMEEDLTNLRSRITQTVIRDVTISRVEDHRTPFLKVASEYFPSIFGEAPETELAKRIEVVIDGAPSNEELIEIYKSKDDAGDWNNVGFRVDGSSKTTWLNKYSVTSFIEIANSEGNEHYSPEELLGCVSNVREDLLESAREYVDEETDETAAIVG